MHPMGVFETPHLYVYIPFFILQVFIFYLGVRYSGFRHLRIARIDSLTSAMAVLVIDVVPFLFYFGCFGIDNYFLDWSELFKIAAIVPFLLTPILIFAVSKYRKMEYKLGKFLMSGLIGIFFGFLVLFVMDCLYS